MSAARSAPRRLFQHCLLTLLGALALLGGALAHADGGQHPLWQIQGRHNVVYLIGSIHVLRESDYPLPPALLQAYADSKSVVMEIDLDEMESPQVQQEMLQAAALPEGQTLQEVLGAERYQRASALAGELGVELSTFDTFAPWFVAEAISQLQLLQLGFQPSSGIEMYFMARARSDGKSTQGLETAHDQIALFQAMPQERQAQYLLSSLEEAKSLPTQVNQMVGAWRRGDTAWFATQMQRELGKDPQLYRSLLTSRNRKWISKIEALLNQDANYLIIVGTGHLAGQDSVIDLLKRDGISVTQR
jgi:uncharacterized protein